MYYLTAKADFDSAHFLLGHKGKCSNLHGHRWTIVAKIAGESLIETGEATGMILDFADFKKILRRLADDLDHKLIVEQDSLKPATLTALASEDFAIVTVDFRPTAENFAKYFYDKLKEHHLPIYEVSLYETPDNCAIYKEIP